MSTIVFQSFISNQLLTVPKHIINELEKYRRLFRGKINHETLFNDCKAGGLKKVDIPNKIIAL